MKRTRKDERRSTVLLFYKYKAIRLFQVLFTAHTDMFVVMRHTVWTCRRDVEGTGHDFAC